MLNLNTFCFFVFLLIISVCKSSQINNSVATESTTTMESLFLDRLSNLNETSVESHDKLSITDLLKEKSVRCHCRYDFQTVYFDAVEPFVEFAQHMSNYSCEDDKTCVGVVCIKVLLISQTLISRCTTTHTHGFKYVSF